MHFCIIFKRRQEIQNKRRIENVWKERTRKVKDEMEECRKHEEFQTCTTQIENCLELLVPPPENFLFSDRSSNVSENVICPNEVHKDITREHGMINRKVDITIAVRTGNELSSINRISICDDNSHILENLKDQHTILKNRLLPKVKKWTITLAKAGTSEATGLLKNAIDIKERLERIERKVALLEMDLPTTKVYHKSDSESDSDENDFEEVPEKEGYEEFASLDDQRVKDQHLTIDKKLSPICSSSATSRYAR